jgi:hypothetical protein
MRKYLLSTSALAGAALLSSTAMADVTISGYSEWSYSQADHNIAASDGNLMGLDQEVHVKFSNKLDNGMTVGATNEFSTHDGSGDDTFMTLSGGFGTLKFGNTDSVASSTDMNPSDLVQEEAGASLHDGNTTLSSRTGTATIGTDTGTGGDNKTKVTYMLPAIGGLTAGISAGTSNTIAGTDDMTAFGARYTLDAGGAAVTLGYATKTTEGTSVDTDISSVGIKVAMNDFTVMVANSTKEASGEDISTQSAGLSYKISDAMTVNFATVTSEDDIDTGEEYDANHYEAVYTIASGLSAVVNVSDWDYKKGSTSNNTSAVDMNGTTTKLTIKASF